MKTLASNRRARHHYELLETYEAGLVLDGWEVKSIRAGRVQIADSYAVISRGEFFLINAHITPLPTVSTHVTPDPMRSRKLLLHQKECQRLTGKIKEAGLSLIPLDLHLRHGKIKATLAVARGKKKHDKRRAIEEREWKREQGRLLRKRG